MIFFRLEEHEQYFKQPQKDLSEDLSYIEADRHGDGVDFVAYLAFEPVFRTDLSVILEVANDRLYGIAPPHAVSFGRGDAALASAENNLHVIIFYAMPPITEINMNFAWFDIA